MLKHNVRFWLLRTIAIALASAASSVAVSKPGMAQNVIIPDATLGSEASQVAPFLPNPLFDAIQGGAVRGPNLFHSFEQFNIGEGVGAYFITPSTDIANIFTRVTGSDASQISGFLGTRQADFATSPANLFLMNPNGVLFGSGASLDLGGSFIATTASSIQFENLGIFSSTSPDVPNSLLTISPSALWFEQLISSPIEMKSATLTVLPEQQLIFLGGDINFENSQIFAVGGDIIIGGVSGQGSIEIAHINDEIQLNFDTITRSDTNFLSGSYMALLPDGEASVFARDITILENSGIFSIKGSFAPLLLLALGRPELVGLRGDGSSRTEIDASGNIVLRDGSSFISATIGTNDALHGLVSIRGSNLTLDGSGIGSLSLGQGSADSIEIEIDGLILLNGVSTAGNPSLIGSPTGSAGEAVDVPGFGLLNDFIGLGDGGEVTIQANTIILEDRAVIGANNSRSVGRAGNVDITVADSLLLSGFSQIRTETTGAGDAGNITIRSGNEIVFSYLSRVRSETSGRGNGGVVDIYAVNRIAFDGSDDAGNRSSVITSVNPILDSRDIRRAGDIIIRTEPSGILQLSNGAVLYSNVESGAIGQGGNIDIQAGFISLSDGSQVQSILRGPSVDLPGAQGETGRIIIRANRDFLATGQDSIGRPSALLTSIDFGTTGISNKIFLEASSITLTNSGRISTETSGSGSSGNIVVIANGSILIEDNSPTSVFGTGIFAQVNQGAVGNGGNISINAQSLTMRALPDFPGSFAQIDATTSGLGNSGNITLHISESISLSGQSLIFNQVGNNGLGQAGDIDITSRSLSMTRGAEVAASVFRAENDLPGGIGEGGDIQINATDFVDIEGIGPGGFSSGIFANTQAGASGTGGNISLTTGALRVANGGVVTAQTLNGSNSGDISIIADTLLLEGGGQLVADTRSGGSAGTIALTILGDTIISGVDPNYSNRFIQFPNAPVANVSERSGIFVPTSQNSTGDGGSIFVQSGSLLILEGGQVSAESLGSGLAGNIEILANSSGLFSYGSTPVRYALLMRNGDISTQAQQSTGGNISAISLGSSPIVLLEDSDITTDSLGNGGNITLDSVVIAFDDSDILARSSDARGGNITLGPFFSDTLPIGAVSPTENNARVDVSADGQLASGAITTPNTSFIQNSLNQLPAVVTDPSTLIAGSCIARTADNQGAFIATGSGGLPARPGDGVISSYPTGSVQPLPATELQAVWQPGDPIVEPTGAFSLPDGRLVLARECDEPAGSSTLQSVLEPTG